MPDFSRVSAIVLAAGFSRRMGENKLVMRLDDKPLIMHTLDLIDRLPFGEKIIVTTAQTLEQIALPSGFAPVINHNSDNGQSESVKLGVSAANLDYCMFFVGDMPRLGDEIVSKIVSQIEADKIIAPLVCGSIKNPVVFPKCFSDALLSLSGDVGGRQVIKDNPSRVKYIEFSDKLNFCDVDTINDLEQFINR